MKNKDINKRQINSGKKAPTDRKIIGKDKKGNPIYEEIIEKTLDEVKPKLSTLK